MYQTINIIRKLREAGLIVADGQHSQITIRLASYPEEVHTAMIAFLDRRTSEQIHKQLDFRNDGWPLGVVERLVDRAVEGATTPVEVYQAEAAAPADPDARRAARRERDRVRRQRQRQRGY